MKKLIAILSVIVVHITFVRSQDLPQPDDNYQKYLDDGISHLSKNCVKLNVTPLLSGWLSVDYERKINRSFGVSVEGEYRLFSGVNYSFGEGLTNDSFYTGGVGASLSGRYYMNRGGIDQGVYYELGCRYRDNDITEEKYQLVTISPFLGAGGQILYGKAIALNIGWRYGPTISKVDENYKGFTSDWAEMNQLYIKLGYFF